MALRPEIAGKTSKPVPEKQSLLFMCFGGGMSQLDDLDHYLGKVVVFGDRQFFVLFLHDAAVLLSR